ncbi:MAG: M23 family metallopeptidase [Magnetococcales bacterium]|nr:M23 family metallopeptidase [Magnetococcales bacterium]
MFMQISPFSRSHPAPLVAALLVTLSGFLSGAGWPQYAQASQAAEEIPMLVLSGTLEAGSAVLLHVKGAPEGSRLKGKLNGHAFPFDDQGRALIALDMRTKPGNIPLRVTVTTPNGAKHRLAKTVSVKKREYKVERIDGLPKKKVSLNKEDLARAKKETASIRATYKLKGGHAAYGNGFQMPVEGRISGVFGSQRILNGKPRSPHSGVDIAAPKGTPIMTIAPGRVVLAGKDYFFTGNTIVIDHGDGVSSLYSHLNAIHVSEGNWAPEGTLIGEIGMTGRATGPHLHWGVRVRGARVDPLMLPGIRNRR